MALNCSKPQLNKLISDFFVPEVMLNDIPNIEKGDKMFWKGPNKNLQNGVSITPVLCICTCHVIKK